MKQGLRSALILTAVAGLGGCVTYPTSYIASGPGGGVDCRYVRCSYDGYAYLPAGSQRYGYAGSSSFVSGPAWYGSSRWYTPYRHGYTAYGFRDPWYDPWRGSFSWSPWYPAWYSIPRSGWSWSIGYGSSYSPWGSSYWYRPWSYSSWYGSGSYGYGWYGGGWRSTWHRPYYGHRPPPRERRVDWRPADGIGVADPFRRPAADEVQRIADRSRFGYSGAGSFREPGDGVEVVRGDVEPEVILEPADPTRLDQRPGRVMPRGAADGWIAPTPGSRVPVNERWEGNAGAVDGGEPSRFDPPPQRYEAPEPQRYEAREPERYERPLPERFGAPEVSRFDPPPQRYEAPEPQRYEAREPERYERPLPERFEAPEMSRFDPPPQRYEAPEPQRYEARQPERYERPLPQRFEAPEMSRFDPPPQRYEAPEPARYERPMPARFEAPEPARFESESDDEPR